MTSATEAPPRDELYAGASELVPLLRQHAVGRRRTGGCTTRRSRRWPTPACSGCGCRSATAATSPTPAPWSTWSPSSAGATARLPGWRRCGAIPAWMVGMFPDEVQDEVFATPDVRICGTLSPTAMRHPARRRHAWSTASGASSAARCTATGRRSSRWPRRRTAASQCRSMALVPMSDLQIVDDWYTAGLQGTGSVTTVAQDVFVPQQRMLPLPAVLQGQCASALNARRRRCTGRRCCRSRPPPRSAR